MTSDASWRADILASSLAAVFLWIVAGGSPVLADDRLTANTNVDASHIEEYMRATRLSEAHIAAAVDTLVENASDADLGILRFHSHDGVALTATWSLFVRGVRVQQRAPTDPPRGARLDSFECSRFLGFLEGRLGVDVPIEWGQCLARGVRWDSGDCRFRPLRNTPYQRRTAGLSVRPYVRIDRGETHVTIYDGDAFCKLRRETFDNGVLMNREVDRLDVVCLDDKCVIAPHTGAPGGRILCCDTAEPEAVGCTRCTLSESKAFKVVATNGCGCG
jgi:hypothetical protein